MPPVPFLEAELRGGQGHDLDPCPGAARHHSAGSSVPRELRLSEAGLSEAWAGLSVAQRQARWPLSRLQFSLSPVQGNVFPSIPTWVLYENTIRAQIPQSLPRPPCSGDNVVRP